MNYTLQDLGFSPYFEDQIKGSLLKVGRVATATNEQYKIFSPDGVFHATILGKIRYLAEGVRDLPCVGDWVLYEQLGYDDHAIIHQILERKSLLSRKVPGNEQKEQIMASNVDTVFLVNALNSDFNLRRMERYLFLVYESGATPVFVLTKKDLCENVNDKISSVQSIAPGVAVVAVDSITGNGYEQILPLLSTGKTVSLLGSSGVGKSSMINRLFERDIQRIKEVRHQDDKGKHTTTHRELFVLGEGRIIIDTPGMRELQLWGTGDTMFDAFQDIEEFANHCQFTDCKHQTEPKCAVKQAIEDGKLDEDRLNSYRKLERELIRLERKEKFGTHRANKLQYKDMKKR
ncbi:ribosome small subunit-dependent GTPase A [Salinibacillus xinjiangensis]|uniref:Small ribosomal subunit biogenesis GTPase RsgA n=1 Tax=Salinibacillus xinjiangensis TaxID=1229268 RepID=A0A6G1X3T7_9BACI|nr:ribosome small subunit-dependent GTPase A [Salinibacillus xinjiangensis]MRG85612.1 ribosome small subunit-dependent GTPase A [Salinibacillus xinjiangensis]